MSKKKTTVEVIPSAKRLIKSLRDIGYDFKHAVADIVDNSVAANATKVAIKMVFEGEDSWLRITDNGSGMSAQTITEAMRFGSEREYEPDELGKFGLGLKTASLSQCSRFTVASRQSTSRRRVEARQWDLAHVDATNRWEIISIAASDQPTALTEPLQTTTGTVVLWEQLDRVLGYKIPWGDRARAGFFRLAEELELHLGMVFHRFLTGEARRSGTLSITINGTEVEPWDPFARDEPNTHVLPGQQFEISSDHGPGLVAYQPYILPSKERFTSQKAFERLAGPGKWNYQQGFYIYRADRMIQSGGWSYMRTSDEHTKLARVAIDFRPDLDSAFDLNVAKARVNLPQSLKSQLKPHLEQLTKQARKAYTPGGFQRAPARSGRSTNPSQSTDRVPDSGAYDRAWRDSGRQEAEFGERSYTYEPGRGAHDDPERTTPAAALLEAAVAVGEETALRRIMERVRADAPEVAEQIGWIE